MSLNNDDVLDSRTSNNTKALIAKQFKGYCRECGEYGHKKINCPKLKRNKKNYKNNKKHPKKNFAKNLTCFYCGKKGHIERDCFKRKRDAGQGIVTPVTKNVEKQEQTETAYGLIAANKSEEIKICSNCVYEGQEVKGCYDQPEERFCITKTNEEKRLLPIKKKTQVYFYRM